MTKEEIRLAFQHLENRVKRIETRQREMRDILERIVEALAAREEKEDEIQYDI